MSLLEVATKMKRETLTYQEYATAQELGMRLRNRGCGNIRIDKVDNHWVLSWYEPKQ